MKSSRVSVDVLVIVKKLCVGVQWMETNPGDPVSKEMALIGKDYYSLVMEVVLIFRPSRSTVML